MDEQLQLQLQLEKQQQQQQQQQWQRQQQQQQGRRQSQHQQDALAEGSHAGEPDLDWPGCGSRGLLCTTEGCKRQYIWLDTPRQSCRFTDEYKLNHRQNEFLRVELARLEEKSVKFARTGCLFGGLSYDTYLWKCIRRTHQLIRLARFVGKMLRAAEADPGHPAHEYASSAAVQESLRRTGDNMATGFEKASAEEGAGLEFRRAWQELLNVQNTTRQRAAACENCTAEDLDAVEVEEQANVTAAMLQLVGGDMTAEQRAKLESHIASEAPEDSTTGGPDDADELTDALAQDVERGDLLGGIGEPALLPITQDQRNALAEAVQKVDVEDPVGSNSSSPANSSNSSALMQKTARGALAEGPLKWIFTHGLGWVMARVAWLVLFILGTALNIIVRGAVLTLSFISCALLRSLSWIFGDVTYNAGWKGNYSTVGPGLQRLGHCAPWAVHFSGIMGPWMQKSLNFASDSTGVHHPWESDKKICAALNCGPQTTCKHAQCFCNAGYYPVAASGDLLTGPNETADKSPSCTTLKTHHGCQCQPEWIQRVMAVIKKKRFGCYRGKCHIDKEHPSYEACKAAILSDMPPLSRVAAGLHGGPIQDTCDDAPLEAAVMLD